MTVPVNANPFLYLVLVRDSTTATEGLSAYLLTVGTPNASPYRSAERFEMRRRVDGGLFDWREAIGSGLSPADFQGIFDRTVTGNYALAAAGAGGALGASDLAEGEIYDLLIVTGGVTIHGSATLPAQIAPRLVTPTDGSPRLIVWNAVNGAAGYIITDGFHTVPSTDTTFTVTQAVADASDGAFIVTAVDANLFAYVTQLDLRRAGIDTAYGVFGGLSQARVDIGR